MRRNNSIESKLGTIDILNKEMNCPVDIVCSGEVIRKMICIGIVSQNSNSNTFWLYSGNKTAISERNKTETAKYAIRNRLNPRKIKKLSGTPVNR